MPIPKQVKEKHKKLNFHTVGNKVGKNKMCSICKFGHSLLGGGVAYCLETGFLIDWDFVCDKYKEEK